MRAVALRILALLPVLSAGVPPAGPPPPAEIDARECPPPPPVTVRLFVVRRECDVDAPESEDALAKLLYGATFLGESRADPTAGGQAVLRTLYGRELTVTVEGASRGRMRARVRDGREDAAFVFGEGPFVVSYRDLGFGWLLVHLETAPPEQDPA